MSHINQETSVLILLRNKTINRRKEKFNYFRIDKYIDIFMNFTEANITLLFIIIY